MATHFEYRSDRNGNECSTVYAPMGARKRRGTGPVGRVCYRGGRWIAAAQAVPGGPVARAEGERRDAAIAKALAGATPAPNLYRTLAQVVAMTGLARQTLARWCAEGKLAHARRGNTYLVRCADVQATARVMQATGAPSQCR